MVPAKEPIAMKTHRLGTLGTLCIPLVLFAWLGSSMAHAANAAVPGEKQYQQDRQVCLDGSSNQDRTTCLKEAGAARAAARVNLLKSPDARTLKSNAMKRCEVHQTQEDRLACERLVSGEGTRTGSVAGGGVAMELVTRSTAPVPAASAPR